MKLTRASSYALHAVAYMASQKQNTPTASHLIAEKRGIPERFLLKVLKPLVSAQVLTSVKGPHGGYQLARPASDVSVLEIIEAVDGPIRGHAPHDSPLASVNRKIVQIVSQSADQTRKSLGKIKISHLNVKE